jgi:tRNA dimethylallyltransferase
MSAPDMAVRDIDVGGIEVVAVFGPTASGKSAVAAHVGDALGTEVVSADAFQVYRELPLLTNQPPRPTRLVAIRSVRDTMSVGEYAALAHAALDEVVKAYGTAVLAGGTGLYLRAALVDLDVPPPVPESRRRWERVYDRDPAAAHAELAARDPAAAEAVHPNDRRRVVRALELCDRGRTLAPPESRLWSSHQRRPAVVFGLDVPADELARRIEERARRMFAAGVADEVRRAIDAGVSPTAAKALGLHEIASLEPDEALERTVARTRRYASYQRKWMRRIPGLVAVDGARPPDAVAEDILAHLRAP